jgi:hypothetical protein
VKERKKTDSALRAIFMQVIFMTEQEKACVRPAGDLNKNQSCVASLRWRLDAWVA